MTTLPQWALEMIPLLKEAVPVLTDEQIQIDMVGEGVALPEAMAETIRAKFEENDFDIFRREEFFWLIESPFFSEDGISVDMRYDSLFEEGTCLVKWCMFEDEC